MGRLARNILREYCVRGVSPIAVMANSSLTAVILNGRLPFLPRARAEARGRKGGAKFSLTKAQVRLAQLAMGPCHQPG